MERSELIAQLALTKIDSLGPVSFIRLVEAFGSAERAFKGGVEELRRFAGLREGQAAAIKAFTDFPSCEQELKWIEREGAKVLSFSDDGYPPLLKKIYAYPPLLFALGNVSLLNEAAGDTLGVVGSRAATEYGVMATRKIVRDLTARGVRIASGFALGIDITAHLAAVESEGKTVAVLPGGLGEVYPRSHRKYVSKILRRGVFITEFLSDVVPHPEYFPRRNRIISGVSRGTLVVEAAIKSGALITADYAAEQNRDLFVVPGSIFSSKSEGCHQLIQQGAKPVATAEDILADWGYPPKTSAKETFAHPDEEKVYRLLLEGPLSSDEVVEKTGLPPQRVTVTLSRLELDGKVKGLGGQRFQSL